MIWFQTMNLWPSMTNVLVPRYPIVYKFLVCKSPFETNLLNHRSNDRIRHRSVMMVLWHNRLGWGTAGCSFRFAEVPISQTILEHPGTIALDESIYHFDGYSKQNDLGPKGIFYQAWDLGALQGGGYIAFLSSVVGRGQCLLAIFSWCLLTSPSSGCLRDAAAWGARWGGDLFRVGVIVGLDVPDSQTNQSKEVWKLVQTGALLLCVLLVYIYWTYNIYNLRCIHIYLQISVTYWQRASYVWQLAAYKETCAVSRNKYIIYT